MCVSAQSNRAVGLPSIAPRPEVEFYLSGIGKPEVEFYLSGTNRIEG